ncbi:FxsB family radical SAM/SPASM domain protein [Actinospica durhamensis]|uniref:FxsB family radical SAM/SPASM domain protein n=1 Tax=Actinospica durhamensis TaxID=1508375 RepID=A0A941EKG0_9ACTN|nr:FxsB family cyclophane-forming radical SAM/SPASM peptide maturase [Actinospica durhamensis]MBR7833237.1 FxsB family radical SAM/SPASM domain protein [Actinospica durhamensis]
MTSPQAWPISQYVLKVHSRCDLACDHCYIYMHADQGWRTQPHRIDADTVGQAGARIAEHAAAHALARVHVILHGGEPLLLGQTGLARVLEELVRRIVPVAQVDLSIHTNGVLLDADLCEVLSEFGVRVGLSLDGDRAANDRHRRYADGRSSHAAVLRASALLRTPRYRHLYAGILCTVDIANEPVAVYRALLEERPPRIDFLLPHATWDDPPPRPESPATPYSDWLGRIFDLWVADGRRVPIRLFESVEAGLRGERSLTEAVGTDPVDLLVIETDGTWEQVDSLKTAYDGAAATGLNVFANSVDEASGHAAVAARQRGTEALCATCRACPVVEVCGGGLYTHRYRTGSGFDNPSVYCDDLLTLITRVDAASTPPPRRRNAVAAMGATGATAGAAGPVPEDLARIAAGPVGADVVGRMAETQESLTRTLFAQVGAMTAGGAAGGPGSAAAWELLCDLDQQSPESVRAIHRHPHARGWAVRMLDPAPGTDSTRDLMQLSAFAAAVAVRAEADADLALPVEGGRLYLPTLGTAVVSGEGTSAHFTVRNGKLETCDQWISTRIVRTDGYDLALEEWDPYRDCYDVPPAQPLSQSEDQAWEQLLTEAFALLRRTAPAHAGQLRAALRSVVPLAPDPTGKERSATYRHAFGSVAVALPDTAAALALLLVHEVQHLLLDAVLDLCDLIDPAYGRRLRVAWRSDPRPATGVLQGAFAHVAMAEVHAAMDGTAPGAAASARRFATWSAQALDALRADRALTPWGERFAGALADRARRVLRESN